jgi:hypothetical protein
MAEEQRSTLRYRILRYTPNLLRDEWVNIGVLLEETDRPRRAMRVIEEEHLGRVRRLHPEADLDLLRGLPAEFSTRLGGPAGRVEGEIRKLTDTLSNGVQFGPAKGLLAGDFDAELNRLYDEQVAPIARARGGFAENARSWLRSRLRDVFRRHRILGKVKENVRVEEFTHPGDTFKFDYGYQNGVEGYVQSVLLARDMLQSKALTYTAEHIRRRKPAAEFTAITDTAPTPGNLRHDFLLRLFAEQNIRVVPMPSVEKFAEELRLRLQ